MKTSDIVNIEVDEAVYLGGVRKLTMGQWGGKGKEILGSPIYKNWAQQ